MNFEAGQPTTTDLPDLPELPADWRLITVNEAAELIQYGTSVKADAGPGTGVPMLRMGNIQEGRLDLADLKYMDPQADNVSVFLVRRGDILFNRTNSPELVGKVAVVDVDREAVFASYLVRVRCNARLVSSAFVGLWINSPWGKRWAQAVKTDGVSQSNINASKLAAMPVPLPPLAEQHEIVRRVEALCKLADAIERRVVLATAQAERLTQAVLARAFRGELVPTEAELARREGRDYQPASVLLEASRERAEGIVVSNHVRPRRGSWAPEQSHR